MVKVSVIIPVYNSEVHLRQCLDSVVNQTLRDIEIICVDDGSADGSAAILMEYVAKDPRVKVITRTHANAGVARNVAMDTAVGEYLAFVDSDDFCDITLYEKAYARAAEEGADLVTWRFDEYDERTKRFAASRGFSKAILSLGRPHGPEALKDSLFAPLSYAPWSRLVRRSLVEEKGVRFQEIVRTNDVLFCCLVSVLSPRQMLVDEVLYHYRTGQSTNLQSSNDLTPTIAMEAWLAVSAELKVRGLWERYGAYMSLPAANSLFYTLHTIKGFSAARKLFLALKCLYGANGIFSTVTAKNLSGNLRTQFFYETLMTSEKCEDYFVRLVAYFRKSLADAWWEKQGLKQQLECTRSELEERIKLVYHDLEDARQINARMQEDVNVLNNEHERVNMEKDKVSRQVTNLKKRQSRMQSEINALKQSESYRLGAAILWPLRKMKSAFTASNAAGGFIKKIRGVAKQFLPYGYMRRHVLASYDMYVPPKGDSPFARFCNDLLPYGVGNGLLGDWLRVMLARTRFYFSERFIIGFSSQMDACALMYSIAAIAASHREKDGEFSTLLHLMDLPTRIDLLPERDSGLVAQRLRELYNVTQVATAYRYEPPKRSSQWERPLLTIIVPVYNVAPFLRRCMESLINQTDRRYEIIAVDDGSADDSSRILSEYEQFVGSANFIVCRKANGGVSSARNFGMERARGKYVSFVDGDDEVSPNYVARILTTMERERLDVCFFDFVCFDSKTKRRIPMYWQIARHERCWPRDRVFSVADLSELQVYGSCWQMAFRREILANHRFDHSLKLGEDAVFVYSLFPRMKRCWCLRDALYYYRKNNAASAVARYSGSQVHQEAVQAKLLLDKRELELYRRNPSPAFAALLAFQFRYQAERTPEVLAWIQSGGCPEIPVGEVCPVAQDSRYPMPTCAAPLLVEIERKREFESQDLILVGGQLCANNIDAIDSWLLFRYLQDRGVPSRYLVRGGSDLHRHLVEENSMKDVIALDSDSRGCELIERHADLFVRARAVVLEWKLMSFMDAWLRNLSGCAYVMLQHGVIGTVLTPKLRSELVEDFNWCNVSSGREKELLGSNCFVAGLPRYDLLEDESVRDADGERIVFAMFTWRGGFAKGKGHFLKSAYWHRLQDLLSDESMERLARRRIRIVFAPHHWIAENVAGFDFKNRVQLVAQDQIAYWIRHCHLMLTDFSSAAFDVMFLRKPTIFWHLDHDDLLLDPANPIDGVKVASAWARRGNFYNVTTSLEETLSLIEHYAACDFLLEPEKVAIADTFFDYRSDFRRRVYEAIERVASL